MYKSQNIMLNKICQKLNGTFGTVSLFHIRHAGEYVIVPYCDLNSHYLDN